MVIMDNLVILTFLIPDYWINDDKCQLTIITMADRGGGGDRSLDAADRTPRRQSLQAPGFMAIFDGENGNFHGENGCVDEDKSEFLKNKWEFQRNTTVLAGNGCHVNENIAVFNGTNCYFIWTIAVSIEKSQFLYNVTYHEG